METGRLYPDHTELRDVKASLRVRIRLLLNEYGNITVGELRKIPKERLMRIPSIGERTAIRIKEFFGPYQSVAMASPHDVADIIEDLRSRVRELEAKVFHAS